MRYLLCFVGILFMGCSPTYTIVDTPIEFDEERIQLTLDYLDKRYGLVQEKPEISPQLIVLHWTAISTLEKSFAAFEKSTLPNWRPEIAKASGLNVSAHFLIDQNGNIYRLMPETTMARHTIGLNHAAIGIENVGGTLKTPLTKKQLRANVFLVEYLIKKYPIKHVIGHYQYKDFENHPLWLEKDSHYRTKKTDPGVDFMEKVFKKINRPDLKFTH